MRNILEHPVTLREIIECLRRHAEKEKRSEAIGGMDALLLEKAADVLAVVDSDEELDAPIEVIRNVQLKG